MTSLKSIGVRLCDKARRFVYGDPDAFLKHCRRIIHIGANRGQERDAYEALGLEVLWIEALPELCEELRETLRPYPKQKVLQALLTDEVGKTVMFNVASNEGASSSIYDFGEHAKMFPDVSFEKQVALKSSTLEALLKDGGYSEGYFDAIVLDVQGAELLVLKGAGSMIRSFKFIRVEACDFESYQGGCQLRDLDVFFRNAGFKYRSRQRIAGREPGRSYYEVLYVRR